ncbi:MAG: SBBP repeat-containing protein, partial [Bacteroidota bacterium]|nr:SBBP repeat-containing protein [Bacteroidota bacterium]
MSHKSQGFVENKGQIIDQNNKPNKEVKFLYNGSGLHVQLRQNGFSYEVIKQVISSQHESPDENNQGSDTYKQQPLADSIYIHRIDVLFDGGNKNAQIKAFEPSTDYINYYTTGTGEAGITNVHHYQKIVYYNIYPKIDVEFVLNPENTNHGLVPHSFSAGGFKYNFIIHPGGDLNDIKLKFLGAKSTSLTEDGHITIETAYGNIDESIPYSYQLNSQYQQKTVQSKFAAIKPVAGGQQPEANLFGIEAKNYDPTKTLVIDPSPWATYFGGGSRDDGTCITHDASGNLIMGGGTQSISNIATSGAYQTTLGGLGDAFIAKFNLAGALQWATYFGGSDNDGATDICADGAANIIVLAGSYTTGLASAGAYQTTLSGICDVIILKLNPSGMRLWSTYYGGNGEDAAYGMTLDASGSIYFTGSTNSTSGIATTGAFKTTNSGGNNDAFVAKFSAGGFPVWATYFGDNGGDKAEDVSVDGNGNIVIAGNTNSYTGIATSGAFQSTFSGGTGDGYIAKFNASGTALLWATYFGSNLVDNIFGLCTDTSGNIFITGETNSVTNIASIGAYQVTFGGIRDDFIAKFSPAGMRLWATYYGGSDQEQAKDIISDLAGNIFAVGSSQSKNNIAIAPSYQDTNAGGYDAFILKINTSGIPLWATYFGGYAWDDGWGLSVDDLGNLAFTGGAVSNNNMATTGAWQTINAGGYDAFIFCIPVAVSPGISNNNISANQGICTGSIPQTLVGGTPIGGSGTYVYSWLSSTTSSTSGFALAGGTNNAINYSPPSLNVNTWYKRAVISGTYFDTSNVVAITVGSKPITSAITGNTTVNNLSVQAYSVTTSPGSIYQWFFTHGTGASISNSINISWNNVGNTVLKVVETTALGCNGDTVYLNITINSATGNNISRNQGICTGYVPQTLTGSIPVGSGPFVYTWLS